VKMSLGESIKKKHKYSVFHFNFIFSIFDLHYHNNWTTYTKI